MEFIEINNILTYIKMLKLLIVFINLFIIKYTWKAIFWYNGEICIINIKQMKRRVYYVN